jgi:rhamnosyltransferase
MNTYDKSPKKENICAIVICYHPEASIKQKIGELLKQVDRVIVIDNGSCNHEKDYLHEVSRNCSQIDLIFNEENAGQSQALNTGIKQAKELDYRWVMTMDQDSLVAPGMVENMCRVYEKFTLHDKHVVSLCPVLASYDGVSPPTDEELQLRSFSGKKISGIYSWIKIVITSGNLLDISIFDKIGFFEEDFFIDYVDQEFSLRIFNAGYKAIQVNNAVLYHNLGNTTEHYFCGKKLLVANNSSLRTYYFYRNGLAVYRKYIFQDFKWVLQDLVKGFIFNAAKIVLFESGRKDKLLKASIGLLHGSIGKMGKYTSSE